MTVMAANWQRSAQAPQCVHLASVHHRHQEMGQVAAFDSRVEKEMQIGFFHVKIHGDQRSIPDRSQRRGYRGLAGAAFAAGHSNDHRPAWLAI